jgi:hypothetical protein
MVVLAREVHVRFLLDDHHQVVSAAGRPGDLVALPRERQLGARAPPGLHLELDNLRDLAHHRGPRAYSVIGTVHEPLARVVRRVHLTRHAHLLHAAAVEVFKRHGVRHDVLARPAFFTRRGSARAARLAEVPAREPAGHSASHAAEHTSSHAAGHAAGHAAEPAPAEHLLEDVERVVPAELVPTAARRAGKTETTGLASGTTRRWTRARRSRGRRAAFETFLAELVVHRALVRIAQHVVRLAHLLELLLSLGASVVLVRMKSHRVLAVRAFQSGVVRVPGDAEDGVVVLSRGHGVARTPIRHSVARARRARVGVRRRRDASELTTVDIAHVANFFTHDVFCDLR